MQQENIKVSYNLSEWKINIIGEQLVEATRKYQSGKLISCFFAWKSIKNIFIARLQPTEQELLSTIEQKAFKNKNNKAVFSFYLDKYINQISLYMNKLGLDFADKENYRGL
jgi:hypothetical protein